jgi:hypothetical protein
MSVNEKSNTWLQYCHLLLLSSEVFSSVQVNSNLCPLDMYHFQVEVTTVFGSAAPPLRVNLVQVLGSDSKVITTDKVQV